MNFYGTDNKPDIEPASVVDQKIIVEGKCKATKVIYQAAISPKENMENKKFTLKSPRREWKQRFYTHKHSFLYPKVNHQTTANKLGN